jgi:hypothetical protein
MLMTAKPGRPKKYDEALERVQVLVPRTARLEAEAIAAKRGVSLSEVYREWMEAGRAQKGKSK